MPDTAVVDVPITSTPATTTSTSGSPTVTATPTTPATGATPAASERPTDVKSLSKFLQKEAATASATTPQPPLVTDSAAAATTPLTTATTAGVPDPNAAKGPIPFDVHHTALENARVKAVADYKQQHGWAEQFNPQQRDWMIDMATRMKDPIAFHRWLGEQLQNDPNYGPKFRPAAPAATKPDPDVQIRDDAGNIVGMSYSADRQAALLKWEREQLTGEFKTLLQPFQQERDQRLQQERTDKEQKALNARADATMVQVNKILGLESLPKDEVAALGKKLLDEMSRTPNAIDAALTLFEREIRPGIEKKGQETALDTNRKKAAANTANGSGAATTATRPTNAKELAKWMAANEGR